MAQIYRAINLTETLSMLQSLTITNEADNNYGLLWLMVILPKYRPWL